MAFIPMEESMVVTTNYVPGYRIKETLGTEWGLTVRSRGLGRNLTASLRSLKGGEITEYVEMLDQSRKDALERLVSRAESKGANAIIQLRFDTSEISQYMTEIVAYGTAVKVEKEANSQSVALS